MARLFIRKQTMEYSNPQLPEGINTSQEHPLKEFFVLLVGVLGALALMLLVLVIAAETLAHHIPFSVEQRMLNGRFPLSADNPKMLAYLNDLAKKIAVAQQLPADMTITVHYMDTDTVNAFATLGGHVVMFRGLLETLPNENALAMVLAHEVAHIKHRDPVRSIGRSVVIGLGLSMVSGVLGDSVIDRLLSGGGEATVLRYSRAQENAADSVALESLVAIYGHVEGATALFEVLEKAHGGKHGLEFFSSHPLTDKRIERIHELAAKLSTTRHLGTTPLPKNFHSWMK